MSLNLKDTLAVFIFISSHYDLCQLESMNFIISELINAEVLRLR